MKIRLLLAVFAAALLAACSSPVSQLDKGGSTDRSLILLRFPDLIVSNVTVTDWTSNTIHYSFTVTNQGNASADQSKIGVQAVISSDLTFFNAGDVPAGGTTLGNPGTLIAPGQSVTGSFSCTLPAGTIHPDTATQYLLIMADYGNQVFEWNENNNVGSVQILPKLPDLVVSNVTVNSYTSTSINYSFTVTNIGSASADQSKIAVQSVVSSDLVFFNAGDVPAGGTTLGNPGTQIAPGQSVTGSFSTSSLPAGTIHPTTATQYLLIMADYNNQVAEQNENNNVGSAQIVPQLPDLITTNVTASYTATGVTYSYTIQNIGNAPADVSGSTLQAYISNGTPYVKGQPAGGLLIGAFYGNTIAPGQSVSGSFSSGLPASWLDLSQPQYLLLCVDNNNAVVESNESNNMTSVLLHS